MPEKTLEQVDTTARLIADAIGEAVTQHIERASTMHPSVSHILKFFSYQHLPAHLQTVSMPFGVLAQQVAERAPDSPETTVALRKLLESKDAAVRAAM